MNLNIFIIYNCIYFVDFNSNGALLYLTVTQLVLGGDTVVKLERPTA